MPGELLKLVGRRTKWRHAYVKNCFPLGYPWECDIVIVKKNWTWIECEVKRTLADFKRDFLKSARVRAGQQKRHECLNKHAFLAEKEDKPYYKSKRLIPRPIQFDFILDQSIIDNYSLENIPSHCGVLVFYDNPSRYSSQRIVIKRVREAPRLKNYAPLSDEQRFNLFRKAANK